MKFEESGMTRDKKAAAEEERAKEEARIEERYNRAKVLAAEIEQRKKISSSTKKITEAETTTHMAEKITERKKVLDERTKDARKAAAAKTQIQESLMSAINLLTESQKQADAVSQQNSDDFHKLVEFLTK